ncbi:hypothetical protein Tco_1141140 [Tanacetum coccineum]
MADNRTMAQMLQAPIEGYEDAIVVPPINANNFELKQPLINLVQSNKFTGRQDPHNHLRFFNKVTSTFRHPEVPNTSIKLLLFPFSLDGEAVNWLVKETSRSSLTWTTLFQFINHTSTLKKHLLSGMSHYFLSKTNDAFCEHGNVLKDSFVNVLTMASRNYTNSILFIFFDSETIKMLRFCSSGNFLDKMPQEGLSDFKLKAVKSRYSSSRAKIQE